MHAPKHRYQAEVLVKMWLKKAGTPPKESSRIQVASATVKAVWVLTPKAGPLFCAPPFRAVCLRREVFAHPATSLPLPDYALSHGMRDT